MELYSGPLSLFSATVRIVLAEKAMAAAMTAAMTA
jgi:hypothetical protein